MCGIAGVFHSQENPRGAAEVAQMISRMAHRGPDGQAVLEYPGITLGHARLAITDLSARASQPFVTADGRFAIVFNGAIYNYKTLRNDLLQKGVQFTTTSDTEVFIDLFAEYGTSCFAMLEGMFAAAIWDSATHKLTLVRDRFGEKPLHYRQWNNRFYFASEPDALCLTDGAPAISLTGLNHFLAIGYVLNPHTIYEDIFSLPPASYMEVIDSGANIKQSCYWRYSSFFETKSEAGSKAITEEFVDLFQRSVGQCTDCEVPYGFFLSGGIDSASVLSMASRTAQQPQQAYTLSFERKKYNEEANARYTARYLGSHHHVTLFRDEEIRQSAGSIIDLLSSPISDNSFLPTFRLSQSAKLNCKVILCGDGADELMAGYSTYRADRLYDILKFIPRPVRSFLSKHPLLPERDKALSAGFVQKQFFAATLSGYQHAHYAWRLLHTPEQCISIMGERHRELVYDTNPFRKFKKVFDECAYLSRPDQCLIVDAHTWLPDNVLVKSDRAMMRCGIEGRSPFLNHKLAEFIAALPYRWKLNGLQGKYLLRQAMKGYLPTRILQTAKKGFNSPPFQAPGRQNQFTTYNEWFAKNYRNGILNKNLHLHDV